MRKKIIAVVVPDLTDSGGVQTIAEMVVRQIEAHPDYECHIYSLATSSSDTCSTRLTKPQTWFKGIQSKKVSWRNREITHIGCHLTELEFMRYKPRKILNEYLEKCDLIQVVCGFPAWGNTVLNQHRPIAVWAATLCAWERKAVLNNAQGLKGLLRRFMTVLTARTDDKVIANVPKIMVMNALVEEHAKKLNHRPAAVVYAPAGVDISWFTPDKTQSPPAPYILAVGRLADARKNMPLLLEAFKLLKKNQPSSMRLTLAGGNGPDESFWQEVEKAGLKNEVEFIHNPTAAALKKLYQQATCLALSSDEEGFGMVLVEAMACGIPVVATRCGGPNNIVSNGVDGFLVETGNAKILSEKLKTLCLDDKLNHEMGLAARRSVERHFSEQAVATIFYNTWKELSR